LARIRDIRSSERRFYQKITDIYAQCSADYDPNEEITRQFFATVQNKLHWAITGQTAAEIIHHSVVGSGRPNMELTHWRTSPKGAIRKTDVSIAKNDLDTQIYKTFAGCGVVDNDKNPCRPASGKHLAELMTHHKTYVFTTIQKFNQEVDRQEGYTRRDGIIVIL
ncbi:MAG: virulence RhuM family protein, partial [Methanophagales archaeon]|nr:virulence RhuM family protein [Methanophagales archaeon]